MNMPVLTPDFNGGNIPVSALFRDQRLAAIFRRGEEGDSLTIPAPVAPVSPKEGAMA